MDRLPNDVARCNNSECPLNNECLRYMDKGDGQPISFHKFEPVDAISCRALIKVKRYVTDEF